MQSIGSLAIEGAMDKLVPEIERILSLSDYDRIQMYGEIGWKLLIRRYVELAQGRIQSSVVPA